MKNSYRRSAKLTRIAEEPSAHARIDPTHAPRSTKASQTAKHASASSAVRYGSRQGTPIRQDHATQTADQTTRSSAADGPGAVCSVRATPR